MGLQEDIQKRLVQAMKDKETSIVSILRLIKSAIKKKEIDTQKKLQDKDIMGLLRTMAKQREESMEQFKKGNRQDLVKKEEAELAVIHSYLPEDLKEEELNKIVMEAIGAVKATDIKHMGAVMKLAVEKAAGRADSKLLSEKIKEKLSS